MSGPITEQWLKSVGFRWHQLDRQPEKHWLLWLGNLVAESERHPNQLWSGFTSYEDLGIELAGNAYDGESRSAWYCWLRADTSHRYSRFLHVRHVKYQEELIALVEALTGQPWMPECHIGGHAYSGRQAQAIRREDDRLDRVLLRDGAKWSDLEKDESRGGALPEHKCKAEGGKEL